MKKLLLLTLTHLFLLSLTIQAQNNVWSLSPNYYKIGNTPPLQPLPGNGLTTSPSINPFQIPNYAGQPAKFSHNAMQDANGDLLFFIVDGVVYNKNGEPYIYSELKNSPSLNYVGYAETMIVPQPGSCNRYYIFTTRPTGEFGNKAIPQLIPGYAILDLSIDGSAIGAPNALIGLVDNGGNQGDVIFNFPNLPTNVFNGTLHYAATDLDVNTNERFIFLETDGYIIRYVLSANGITYGGLIGTSLGLNTTTSGRGRGEMEVVKIPTGYRLAVTSAFQHPITNLYTSAVAIFELNNQGIEVGTPEVLFYDVITAANPLPNNFSTNVSLKGLEFSPDGNYLYINRTKTAAFPSTLEVYQIGSGLQSPNIPTIITPNSEHEEFRFSQIELDKFGNLTFANSTQLATLSNPNSPPGIWTNVATPINYSILPSGSTHENDLSFQLPDQIDGMDYTAYLVDPAIAGIECCRENTGYDISKEDNNNVFSGNLNWDGLTLNNPWSANSTTGVTVKDQMIIQNGANVVINNMRFEFAPEAQLIIEDGARLTINGTTLTADTRCDANAMWHGVEVWGNGTFQAATSGRFVANNSLIEHAVEATANYKHTLTNGGSPAFNQSSGNHGGIIQLTGTTMHNNKYDVNMIKYQSAIFGNQINDQSIFKDCNFLTDNLLNDPAQLPIITHVNLNDVNGIRFLGCKFENADLVNYSYLDRGDGINSQDTKFQVTDFCSVFVLYPNPCPSPITSEFTNLTEGIRAGGNPMKTASITNTTFFNIWRGVTLLGLDVANVSDNVFDVGMNSGPIINNAVSYGLVLFGCDGYKVENNDFHTSFSGYLGCGVLNSGVGANEIYRNNFTDLTIGSQAFLTNGDGSASTAQMGLEFRCNNYSTISDYDILVSSGRVRSDQGNCNSSPVSPANNQFSYTAQFGDYWLFYPQVSITSTYWYSSGAAVGDNLEPRTLAASFSGDFINPLNTAEQECSPIFPAFSLNTSCPKRIKKTKAQLKNAVESLTASIGGLKAQLDDDNIINLLALINQQPAMNAGQLKNILSAAKPLSSEVLIALINSDFPNGNLKDILKQNSPLSNKVLNVLINKTPAVSPGVLKDILEESAPLAQFIINELRGMNLPRGVIKNIENNQDNEPKPLSQSQVIEQEIAFHENELTRATNDFIRLKLFDFTTSDKENFRDVVDLLREDEANNTNKQNQQLINALIANEDYAGAQQKLIQLDTKPVNADFCKLKNTVVALQQFPEKEMALRTNMNLQQSVTEVATETTNMQEVISAQMLKEKVNLRPEVFVNIEIITPPNVSARMGNTDEEEQQVVEVSKMAVYPNPAKEQFTLTHNLSVADGTIILNVYDLMGRVLITQKANDSNNIINVSELKSGIYFYSITQNGETIKSDKLMIE